VCAFLVGTTDVAASVERCGDVATATWGDRRVGWLPPVDGLGGRIGLVEA
jgi:hypothetical protein